jgi:hypothetical protein
MSCRCKYSYNGRLSHRFPGYNVCSVRVKLALSHKKVQPVSEAHPVPDKMGNWVLCWGKNDGGLALVTHFYLAPGLRISGAIALLP